MNFEYSAGDLAFRDEVRDFLSEKLPQKLSSKVALGTRLSKQDMELWHSILNARGWLANHWPEEWGGTGWSVLQRFIFETETAMAHAPRIVPFGISMLAPVLIKYGSEEQKRHFLPRILDGTDWWCQGYSEPGAGSDLASLKTMAVRQGDAYIVNGQKTWTTLAQYADWIFCLVRTSSQGRKQEGISFLLIDMRSPGIEVRPIRLLDGDYEVNEVFFTDVMVPAENLVGDENSGWTYAKYLLTYERTNIAGIGGSMAQFERLRQMVSSASGATLARVDNPAFKHRLAKLEIALENMKTTNLRVLTMAGSGNAPSAHSSMLKIIGTQIRQEIHELMCRAVGPAIRPLRLDVLEQGPGEDGESRFGLDAVASQYFNNRKLSIFGGSNEIQREIIAKQILEL